MPHALPFSPFLPICSLSYHGYLMFFSGYFHANFLSFIYMFIYLLLSYSSLSPLVVPCPPPSSVSLLLYPSLPPFLLCLPFLYHLFIIPCLLSSSRLLSIPPSQCPFLSLKTPVSFLSLSSVYPCLSSVHPPPLPLSFVYVPLSLPLSLSALP